MPILKNVQVLRALAANGVVIGHLAFIEAKYGHGVTVLPAAVHALIGGIDLFFVISGFIMVTVMSRTSPDRFLLDRVTRIYPPYWLYTTIALVVYLITPAWVNSSYPQPPSIWRSYLLLPDSVPPLLVVGWTLIHEMYFYLVFAAIISLVQRTKTSLPVWLSAWAALVVILNGGVENANLHAPIVDVIFHPLTLEFIAGACIGLFLQQGLSLFGGPVLVLGVLQFVAVYLVAPDANALTDTRDWTHVLLIGIPCALMVYGAAAMERASGGSKAPGLLVTLGNASYSTYLSHILVLSAVGRLFAEMPWHSPLIAGVFLLIGLAVANGWGWVSYRLIEKPLQRWTRAKLNA